MSSPLKRLFSYLPLHIWLYVQLPWVFVLCSCLWQWPLEFSGIFVELNLRGIFLMSFCWSPALSPGWKSWKCWWSAWEVLSIQRLQPELMINDAWSMFVWGWHHPDLRYCWEWCLFAYPAIARFPLSSIDPNVSSGLAARFKQLYPDVAFCILKLNSVYISYFFPTFGWSCMPFW